MDGDKTTVLKNIKFYSNGEYRRVNLAISGTNAWITEDIPSDSTEVELSYCTVIPGLVDTHCHLFELGFSKRTLDLTGVKSIHSLRLKLQQYLKGKKEGEWVFGRGWDQELFEEGRFPTREDIDDISLLNPVLLKRVCGHIALINTSAIELLGLENEENKMYERDCKGRLTGIVKEDALEEALRRADKRNSQLCSDILTDSEYEALRHGITKAHCILSPSNYVEELEAINLLLKEGELLIKLRLYLPIEAVSKKEIYSSFQNNDQVSIKGFKIFADGSLGSRTAALEKEYSDDPGNFGVLRYRDSEMREMVQSIDAMGMQAVIHAIGDRAIAQAIDAISSADRRNRNRHRIEHASLAPKSLREEMSRKRIPATVQPHFVASDKWAEKRLGDRVKDLYPFNSFIREGVIISGSSDAPVEPLNPMLGFWAAISRPDMRDSEALSIQSCIDIYTKNADYNGLDRSSGTDLVLLDSDIEGMHPSMLRKVKPLVVIVSGRICFQSLVL